MKREDINIRDPYVLMDGGKYYLYGTRSETCWGPAEGFDCYVSSDLREFEGPIEIFHRPEGFFATESFWAPECYKICDAYYLVTTFGGPEIKKGIYILKSDSPTGPFSLYSERLTPSGWTCIDGTLFFEENTVHLVFSHSFEDALDGTGNADGDFCRIVLSADLKKATSEPVKMFSPRDISWAMPVPFARQEFGLDGECYFSDGPSLFQAEDGTLYMMISSWGGAGYAVGIAKSESGYIWGPWTFFDKPLFPENGGHGMIFRNIDGQLVFTIHFPNDKYSEHPHFWRLSYVNNTPVLGEELV